MPTLIPVTDGFFQISNVGGVYTRSAPANPAVKEDVGDNDIVTIISFDISGLAGETVTSITLNTGVESISPGTGAETLSVVDAHGDVATPDADLFENAHGFVPAFQYGTTIDSLGAKTISFDSDGLIALQTLIDLLFSEWAIGLTFTPEGPIGEHITISASPTLTVEVETPEPPEPDVEVPAARPSDRPRRTATIRGLMQLRQAGLPL